MTPTATCTSEPSTGRTNALGRTSYFHFDAAGQQVVSVDARGYPTYYAYDLAGRQQSVTDALGHSSYFVYDAAGRQTVSIASDGTPTYFVYDALGRTVSQTDALGNANIFSYDAAGQRTASIDALGNATYYGYDAVGRTVSVLDAAGGAVYYVYNAVGGRTAVIDQRGYASYFAYDAAGRQTAEVDPLGNATYYAFDAAGRLIRRTDGKGQHAYFTYDAVGRQTVSQYADVAAVYFEYDAAGRRTRMRDEWGVTYWSYDAMGRPTRRHDPRGTVVAYAYGEGGQRTELTVEGQGTVYYEYDELGRMSSVLDGKTGLATTYEYDPAGRLRLQAHPNGSTSYFTYDAAGRLEEKVTRKDADASELVRFAYTRDAAGNPVAIDRESGLGVFYYEYDALQRLTYEGQFVSAVRQYENYYEYDAAGNRTLLRHGESGADDLTYYGYNAANELTSLHDAAGWTYYGYDANGNTVMEQKPSYTRYYEWDGRDMMVGVRSTEGGWTDNVYRYDGTTSRVSTLESGGLTYYDWDGINVIQEKDAAGGVTDRQVHGYAPIPSVGDIALMDKGGTPYVPVSDQPGTVWNLLDDTASKANAYGYDAFGVGRSASETVANAYRFAGLRLSSASQYYAKARWYSPGHGRFSQKDVALRTQQPSYTYAGNDPVGAIDWLGMRTIGEKICRKLGLRATRGLSLIGLLVNVYKDEYTFTDDESEMNKEFGAEMRLFYDHYVQELDLQGRLSAKPQQFRIPCTNAVSIVGRSLGETGGRVMEWVIPPDVDSWCEACLFLHYSSHVYVSGKLEAWCDGSQLYYRNVDAQWVWRDLVDFHSWDRGRREDTKITSRLWWLIEGSIDAIGDKLLDTEFWVNIVGKDQRPGTKGIAKAQPKGPAKEPAAPRPGRTEPESGARCPVAPTIPGFFPFGPGWLP